MSGAGMEELVAWVVEHQAVFSILALLSLALLVVSMVVFPLVVVHLPVDYFVRENREPVRRRRQHPALWAVLSVAKNAVGAVLIVAGTAMLVLPGQGILTILIGLALTNFPGKFAFERRLFGRPPVHRALNRIRKTAGKTPLRVPEQE
ncbi:MAG: PGPGW domain-containing protein [Thermoanaerobaculales bacterium]|nr:PGPGW domain-containing protein [Thermoanaerobaculales bacterium]